MTIDSVTGDGLYDGRVQRARRVLRTVKLRYDGKYDFMPADCARQWTILSHFIDENGQDRFKGSFGLKGLIELGIIKRDNGGINQ